MQSRVIRIVAVGLIAIGVAMYFRMARRGDTGKTARANATEILTRVENYEANRRFYETHSDPAHQAALDKAYTIGGRRTRDTFDEGVYMSVFFDRLMTRARDEGKPDVVKSLTHLCDEEGIEPVAAN